MGLLFFIIIIFFILIFPGVKHSSQDSECGEGGFHGSCEISSESAEELLWCELLSNSPRAGLVARSGEMGTCHSVLVERGAFSATQSNPDPTRTAWRWDRAFKQLYSGLWAVGHD